MKHINQNIPNGISYSNASDALESKMESCFDVNDLEYFESLLLRIKKEL